MACRRSANGRFAAVEADLVPAGSVVRAIHQDRAGAIWFGTQHGLVRHQDGASTLLTTRDGLAANDVRVIVESRTAGRMWIGGPGGLTRWQDGKLTRWTEADGLPSRIVRAVHEDDDGVLWIGTYDSGLARLEQGRFTHYTTRIGLFNDGVFQILEDGRGNLWMSSNRGISRVRKQELDEVAAGTRREVSSIAYGRGDGMLNVECNGGAWPAGIEARDGTLWFPTQDGVAVIDPASVSTNPRPPPVVIESFLLDREPVVPVPFDRPLRIAPGRGTFEIGYTSLSFVNPEHVRFRYRLTGLDDDWIDARTRRTAYYSHVPPGRYTFTVIAANSDGVWNTTGSQPADRRAAALLSHVVVRDADGGGRRRARRGHVEAAGVAPEARARRPAGVLAPADRLAGSRAQAHRGGAARQPRPAAGRHQEPGGAGERRERRRGSRAGSTRSRRRRTRPSGKCGRSPRTCGRTSWIGSG